MSASNRPEAADRTKSLMDALLAVEQMERAHEVTVAGVHVWSALRNQLFVRLAVQMGLWQASRATQAGRWARVGKLPRDILLRNPFLIWRRARNLVVKWERMQPWHGRMDDVISRPLRDQLSGTDFIEMDVLGGGVGTSPNVVSMAAVSTVAFVLRPLFSKSITASERSRIADVEAGLQRELGVSVALVDWFVTAAREFRIRKLLLRWLFHRWQVQNVFIVVAYGHPEVVAAARECGARVIELQHGMIHHAHPGYQFGEERQIAYRPDCLLLHGDYWRTSVNHYRGTRLMVCGAPYILDHIARSAGPEARDRIVLFVSQSGITEHILQFAIDFVRFGDAPKVLFRLHPNDDLAACRSILTAAGVASDRLELSAGGGGPRTLALLASARYQVGVFSTAVLEGLALGSTTFLIPVTGWSGLSRLVEAGYARLAETPGALLHFITQDETGGQHSVHSVDEMRGALFSPWQADAVAKLLGDDAA